jgi:hypothetical protein
MIPKFPAAPTAAPDGLRLIVDLKTSAVKNFR